MLVDWRRAVSAHHPSVIVARLAPLRSELLKSAQRRFLANSFSLLVLLDPFERVRGIKKSVFCSISPCFVVELFLLIPKYLPFKTAASFGISPSTLRIEPRKSALVHNSVAFTCYHCRVFSRQHFFSAKMSEMEKESPIEKGIGDHSSNSDVAAGQAVADPDAGLSEAERQAIVSFMPTRDK